MFIAVGVTNPNLLALVVGVLVIVLVPIGYWVVHAWLASKRGQRRTLTLTTDKAHLVIGAKVRRGTLVLKPTDHWVDRRKIRGEIVRGQAIEFRRAVLRVMLDYAIETDAVVKARATNPKIRLLYAADLTALGLDPEPFLRGGGA